MACVRVRVWSRHKSLGKRPELQTGTYILYRPSVGILLNLHVGKHAEPTATSDHIFTTTSALRYVPRGGELPKVRARVGVRGRVLVLGVEQQRHLALQRWHAGAQPPTPRRWPAAERPLHPEPEPLP